MNAKKGSNKINTYFENLDGLRFFCFLAVFLYHSFTTGIPEIQQNEIYRFVKFSLFGNGFLGVNFFFVLSGFLITYLLIIEKQSTTKINTVKFWIRRILRIWPLYFACVFYGFFVFPLTKSLSGSIPNETADIRYYLAFISNFDYINKGLPDSPGLGVLWSVAIEEQFYFVWPLLLTFFPVLKYWIPLSTILISSLIFRAVNDVPILHEMHTLSCIGDMALGGLGAWLVCTSATFKKSIEDLSPLTIISIYLLFFICFLFRDQLFLRIYWLRIIERLFISTLMLLIILEQCYSQYSFYKMGRFKIPTKLGLITYGLYCLHFIVIPITVGIFGKIGLNSELWQILILIPIVSLVLSIVISKMSYKYFESPFLKLKEKFVYAKEIIITNTHK